MSTNQRPREPYVNKVTWLVEYTTNMARSATCKLFLQNSAIFRQFRVVQRKEGIHSHAKTQETVSISTSDHEHRHNSTDKSPRDRQHDDSPASQDPAFRKIDLTFENAREAYKSKTNGEIIRSLCVFNLCSIRYLVQKNEQVHYIIK